MTTPPPADPRDVAQWAASLDATALQCRAKGHPRDGSSSVTWDRSSKTWHELESCACGASWETVYDADGYVITRRMHYTDPAYLRPRGSGRIDRAGRAALRRERFSRTRPLRKAAGS